MGTPKKGTPNFGKPPYKGSLTLMQAKPRGLARQENFQLKEMSSHQAYLYHLDSLRGAFEEDGFEIYMFRV